MTSEEALKILDDLTSKVHLTRVDHERVIRAINVLSALIAEKEKGNA